MMFEDPYSLDPNDWLRREKERFMWGQAVRDPRAQFTPTMVADPVVTMTVVESEIVPDGGQAVIEGRMVILPKFDRYGYRAGVQALTKQRTPLFTRCTLGSREAARDRRRGRRAR